MFFFSYILKRIVQNKNGDKMKQTLFLDAATQCKDKKILIAKKKTKDQVVCHYYVDSHNKEILKHDAGDYFTIQFTEQILRQKPESIQKEFQKIITTFLKKYHKEKTILVVGLGNSSMLADSLGKKVNDQMISTNQYNDFLTIPKVALLTPEVYEKTGISSFKLIRMVVEDLKPDLIIMIDSLATNDPSSLNRVVEINDTGIIPGSALRSNKEINKNTFQIPILSIGIPLLYKEKERLLESIHLQEEIKILSNIIANGLNQSILF